MRCREVVRMAFTNNCRGFSEARTFSRCDKQEANLEIQTYNRLKSLILVLKECEGFFLFKD